MHALARNERSSYKEEACFLREEEMRGRKGGREGGREGGTYLPVVEKQGRGAWSDAHGDRP